MSPVAGVANLMLDILSQLQRGGNESTGEIGPSSLLLLGPPGVGASQMLLLLSAILLLASVSFLVVPVLDRTLEGFTFMILSQAEARQTSVMNTIIPVLFNKCILRECSS